MKKIISITLSLCLLMGGYSYSVAAILPSTSSNILGQIASSTGFTASKQASSLNLQQIQSTTSSIISPKDLKAKVADDAKKFGLKVNKKALAALAGESIESEEDFVIFNKEKNLFEGRLDLEPTLDTYIYDTGLVDLTKEGGTYNNDLTNTIFSTTSKQQARVKVYIDFKRKVQWGDIEHRMTLKKDEVNDEVTRIGALNGRSSAVNSIPIKKQLNYAVQENGSTNINFFLWDKHDKNSLQLANGDLTKFSHPEYGTSDKLAMKQLASHDATGTKSVLISADFVTASAGTDGTTTASFEASNAPKTATDAVYAAGVVRYSATTSTTAKKFDGDSSR